MMTNDSRPTPHVGLFATCLMNAFRPGLGFAAMTLLEEAGCRVSVPADQTCCGQPALNSGDREGAQALARQVVASFEGFDYVVGPSGSCLATLRHDVPELLADDPEWAARARQMGQRCHELMSFLADVLGYRPAVRCAAPVMATYHDSCSGLRSLGIKGQPRQLLAGVDGLSLTEMDETEVCCGFGGTFCVKYPEISTRLADNKLDHAVATGASLLLGGDLGCLMHLAGRASRRGLPIKVRHAAEVLAGMDDRPALCEPEEKP